MSAWTTRAKEIERRSTSRWRKRRARDEEVDEEVLKKKSGKKRERKIVELARIEFRKLQPQK